MKSLAHTEITRRVSVLNSAVKRASTLKGLGADRGALESYLGKDIAPLQQLDTKIQSDGTLQQATADYEHHLQRLPRLPAGPPGRPRRRRVPPG